MGKSVRFSIFVVSMCLCLVYTSGYIFAGRPKQQQGRQQQQLQYQGRQQQQQSRGGYQQKQQQQPRGGRQQRQPMPLCVMDCLAEWFPCEYECRVDWGSNRRQLRTCTKECEQERASCMTGSSDPACSNNKANNQLHVQFKTL
ncbi:uncharacterized protein LOC128185697 [Crassostrea angulata]|uniref:uncharacterized protein LOC128185697 n=1 Tax=Magallana angulata TaxID=2784310 RepID=UPI0022B15FE4|nr:uncharacterized protein LOC128185697 [Crassostrea angulata]